MKEEKVEIDFPIVGCIGMGAMAVSTSLNSALMIACEINGYIASFFFFSFFFFVQNTRHKRGKYDA